MSTSTSRKVAFSSKVKMRISLHISDYTLEEMQASFYDYIDIQDFKDDAKCIARKIEETGSQTEDDYCLRGLEQMMTEDSQKKRKAKKRSAVSIVLKEQFWSDNDPTVIAKAYSSADFSLPVLLTTDCIMD